MKFFVVLRIMNETTQETVNSTHHSFLSESEIHEMVKKLEYIFSTDYVSDTNETYHAIATITRYDDKKEIYKIELSNRSAIEKDIWLQRNLEMLNQ